MSHDPDRHVIEKAYARWAPIYDALCGPVFVNGDVPLRGLRAT